MSCDYRKFVESNPFTKDDIREFYCKSSDRFPQEDLKAENARLYKRALEFLDGKNEPKLVAPIAIEELPTLTSIWDKFWSILKRVIK